MTDISPPTLLATFSNNHASSSKLPHVTLSSVGNGDGSVAVAAVQGDGIWTYDLSTLRPTTSFTVAPSTTFASKALSFLPSPLSDKAKSKQKANGDAGMEIDVPQIASSERVTLVAVSGGDKIRQDQQGKVLWIWKGEGGGDRQEVTLPHAIHTLLYTSMSLYPVICVGTSGEITLLDKAFQPISTPLSTPTTTPTAIIRAQILSSRSNLARLVLVSSSGRISTVEVKILMEEITAEVIKSEWVDGKEHEAGSISVADISEHGEIIALDSQNRMISRNIREPIPSGIRVFPTLAQPASSRALISLPTSSKALCLFSTAHPELSLVLANASPALPAVINALPLSLATSGGIITHLALLARPSSSTALIGLVVAYQNGDDNGRSVLYTSEITTPEKGIGLNLLLGSQKLTNEYFITSASTSKVSSDSPEEVILRDIEGILRTSGLSKEIVAKAEQAWTTWVNSRSGEGNGKHGYALSKDFAGRLLTSIFGAALVEDVKEDVKIIKRQGPYAGAIIKDLVERGWLRNDMYAGGVVEGGLIPANDWDTIDIVISRIPSLAPKTLIALINSTITSVESLIGQTGRPVNLEKMLLDILNLPPPAPAWRVELRRHLSAEEALKVLEVYAGWLEVHAENQNGINGWDQGEAVMIEQEGLPGLESLIQHTSLLLDAHLPSLIPLDDAQPILERISGSLEPLISTLDTYRALRAPVEGVLTLAKREERKRKDAADKRAAQKPAIPSGYGNGSKSGNAKAKARAVMMENTRGEVTEEMVGQWRVEDIVF